MLRPLRHLRRTALRECERCGLLTPTKREACRHCAQLDDEGVAALRERHASEQQGNHHLGRNLLLGAVLLLALLIAGL